MRWRSAVLLLSTFVTLSACGGPSPEMGEEASKTETAAESETMNTGAALETTEPHKTEDRETGETETSVSVGEPSAVSGEFEVKTLTREKVLELAGREDLSWKDFEDYSSRDIGSGLRILAYPIDRDFSLLIGGGGTDQEPMYIRLEAGDDYMELRENSARDVEGFFEKHASREEYVGIRAHIKEVRGDRALVSSDTDQFPGTFWVTGVAELAAGEELKGGASVFVLMEDTGEKEADQIRIFVGKQLVALSQEADRPQEDILLTSAPLMTLTDVLSSRYDPIEVLPENYTWGIDEGGEVREVVACGSAPLDNGFLGDKALKLPNYNNMDKVFYSFSTVFTPDQMVVRQWNLSDTGSQEAKEERVMTLYYVIPAVGLEKDKVYEFEAEWEKENLEKRGFCGRASYVLATK